MIRPRPITSFGSEIALAGTATAHETGSLVPHEDSLTLTGRYLGVVTEASGDDISDHPGEAKYVARFKAAIGDRAYYIDEDKPYSGDARADRARVPPPTVRTIGSCVARPLTVAAR